MQLEMQATEFLQNFHFNQKKKQNATLKAIPVFELINVRYA